MQKSNKRRRFHESNPQKHNFLIGKSTLSILIALTLVLSMMPMQASMADERLHQADLLLQDDEVTVVYPSDATEASFVEDEILVVFKDDVSLDEAKEVIDHSDGHLEEVLADETGGTPTTLLVNADAIEETIEELASEQSIAIIQPNFIYSVAETDIGIFESQGAAKAQEAQEGLITNEGFTTESDAYYPNDPDIQSQWHLEGIGAYEAWGALKAGNYTTRPTVAVFDTGFDVSHPDLRDNIVGTWNAAYGSTSVTETPEHGTQIAGIISATADNGIGIAGVSNNAGLYLIKASERHEGFLTSDLCKSYEHLIYQQEGSGLSVAQIHNVKVVNMSLGGRSSFPDAVLDARINEAASHGILTVCAAGNENENTFHMPSDYEACIGVINLQEDDRRNPYSNYGWEKDISAPGEGVKTVGPDGEYWRSGGTSAAAPVVSGVAALLYYVNPDLTVTQAKAIITSTATDLGEKGRDIEFGYGKVNAHAAVEKAISGEYDELTIDNKSFPDSVFRNYVLTVLDTDRNQFLSKQEIDSTSTLSVSNLNIESLKGVEHFTNLKVLNCSNNKLTKLDLSKNQGIQSLDCSNNQLFDISIHESGIVDVIGHSQQLTVFVYSDTPWHVSTEQQAYNDKFSHSFSSGSDVTYFAESSTPHHGTFYTKQLGAQQFSSALDSVVISGTVDFIHDYYTITTLIGNEDESYGTVSASPQKVIENGSSTITVLSFNYRELDSLTVNGVPVTPDREPYGLPASFRYKYTYLLENVNSQVEVVATFKWATYTLSFDSNTEDEVVNMPESQEVPVQQQIYVPEEIPKRLGYSFLSWNTKADGTGTSLLPGEWGNENGQDIILYAQWAPKTDIFYTVRYLHYDTGADVITPKTVTSQALNSTVIEVAPSLPGYKLESSTQEIVLDTNNKEIVFTYIPVFYVSYLVKHIERWTSRELAPAEIRYGLAGKIIPPTALDIDGYVKASNDFAPGTSALLIINGNKIRSGLVVTIEYVVDKSVPWTLYHLDSATGIDIVPPETIENDYNDFIGSLNKRILELEGYTVRHRLISGFDSGPEMIYQAFIYYAPKTDVSYTVRYVDAATGADLVNSKAVTNQTFNTVVTETAPSVFGYTVDRPSQEMKLDTYNKEIVFSYIPEV